jgi:FkbM family methyltransferase
MVRQKIKKVLSNIGVLPVVLYYKKRIMPDKHDKKQASLMPRYKKFYSKFIKKEDLCFDIGAHMGNRVDIFLDCGAKVVAVEPFLECYKYMKFKYGNSVTILNKGAGPDTEDREMFISDDPTTNSFSSDWVDKVSAKRFKGREWKKKQKMKMTSLDELIKDYGIPAFCKIDVEGFELDVLKGLSQTIKTISFEYTVPEEIVLVTQCIDKLLALNPSYKFNYSVGETMALHLGSFLSAEEFKEITTQEAFIQSSCGDIYATVSPF